MLEIHQLPALNAFLNGVCTVFLLLGWWFIRHEERRKHIAMMIGALASSVLFLIFYCIYHANVGVGTKFEAQGIVRPIYFFILITHIVLAMVIVPLVPTTVVLAIRGRYERHRRWARWTMPIWVYVSITGVLVYLMLYRWFPPASIAGAATGG